MIDMQSEKREEKNKISIGLIISKQELNNNTIFPNEIKEEILDSPFYLLIFISREDVVKVSCFPTKTDKIKKILIKLKEFSPNLVKGISKVLKELDLSKEILHTTGLCYEMENCFYETYLIGESLKSNNIETIKENFFAVPKVINVMIEDIPSLS